MIKNERQYKIARANLQKWLKNLEIHKTVKQDVPDWVLEEQRVSICEQVKQLQAEIKEYEDTVSSGIQGLPDLEEIIESLPMQLIKWRIAQRLTQSELAILTGLHENLLQKYEQENYSGVSLKTMAHIAHTLKDKGAKQRACCAAVKS